ncbi:MAG: hypothetical protein P8Z37_03460 [Acidobacteriota bacterium]
MKVRSEVVQAGVDTRRATEDPAGVLEQYVEGSEDELASILQCRIDGRSRHAWMCHRSRSFMNNPG